MTQLALLLGGLLVLIAIIRACRPRGNEAEKEASAETSPIKILSDREYEIHAMLKREAEKPALTTAERDHALRFKIPLDTFRGVAPDARAQILAEQDAKDHQAYEAFEKKRLELIRERAEKEREEQARLESEHLERERVRLEEQRRIEAFKKLIAGPIPLQRSSAGVVLGTDICTGETVTREVERIPHLLVVGTSGFGKSVFLHQVVSQLVGHDKVERMYLVDFKGGVEFNVYDGRPGVHIVWQFSEMVEVVEGLVREMHGRLAEMRSRRTRTWTGPRIFFVVDEFAQIQLWPVTSREEKAAHARLMANLNSLSMLGRSPGIVLIVAVQKPTTDVMDSSFRENLQGVACYRVATKLMAASIFGSTDELKLDPTRLKRGRCIFYDAMAGETYYLQAHVAPEADR